MAAKTADLLKQLVKLIDRFHDSEKDYIKANPGLLKDKDVRLTVYRRCISSLDVAMLYLMFRTFQLPTETWWKSIPNEFRKMHIPPIYWRPHEFDRAKIMGVMDNYWSVSLFLLLFNTLESAARTMVRTAFPGKVNDGRGQIQQIFEKLLSKKYSRYKKVLQLFRLCRNTMHNNGVYFPDIKGNNIHITYKTVDYDFIDGKPVELGSTPRFLLFDIVPEILNVINDIVNSPEVVKHNQIIDPSAR